MLRSWLPKHLEANDDLTLEEHRETFEEEFGQRISTSTIGRAIAALPNGGWPTKKSQIASERDEQARGLWRVAGFPLRRGTPRVRGRERLYHLHDAPERQRSERKEGLRKGSQEPQ